MNWTRPMGQGGPLCFSSSGGWECLMDPNWTHIYCARFSWSVTGMMMPQLEPLTGWLCLPFWKVFTEWGFFFSCQCDPVFKGQNAQRPSGKIASCFDRKDDGGSTRRLSSKHNALTICLGRERKMPRCVKQSSGWGNCPLRCLSKSQKLNTKLSSLLSSGQNVSSHGRHARLSEPVENL